MLHYHAGIYWSDYQRATPIADVKAACQLAGAMGLPVDRRSVLAIGEEASLCFSGNKNSQDLWGRRSTSIYWPLFDIADLLSSDGLPRLLWAKRLEELIVPDEQIWLYQATGPHSLDHPDMILHVLGESAVPDPAELERLYKAFHAPLAEAARRWHVFLNALDRFAREHPRRSPSGQEGSS
jgi:hypothetical protein